MGLHGVSCLCSWSKFASVSLGGVAGAQSGHSWDLVSRVECWGLCLTPELQYDLLKHERVLVFFLTQPSSEPSLVFQGSLD